MTEKLSDRVTLIIDVDGKNVVCNITKDDDVSIRYHEEYDKEKVVHLLCVAKATAIFMLDNIEKLWEAPKIDLGGKDE